MFCENYFQIYQMLIILLFFQQKVSRNQYFPIFAESKSKLKRMYKFLFFIFSKFYPFT